MASTSPARSARHHQNPGPACGDDAADVATGQQRIHRRRDGADAHGGEEDVVELDRVEHHHRHALLRGDAEAAQPGRRGGDLVEQLGVGDRALAGDDRRVAAAAGVHVAVEEVDAGVVVAGHPLRRPALRRRHSDQTMTYSKSTGRAWIPDDGGATQPAILPGSVTPTISDSTKARSSAVGSHSATPAVPLLVGDEVAVRAHPASAERPDAAIEADVGEHEPLTDFAQRAVPPIDALAAVGDEVVAQRLVEGRQRRRFPFADPVVGGVGHRRERLVEAMVVVALLLVEAALEAGGEVVGGVRRRLGAEQVERHAAVEVEVALQRRHVDAAERTDVAGVVLLDQLHRPLDDAPDAGGADEHVVGFFLEHEVARARQRVEPRLAQ